MDAFLTLLYEKYFKCLSTIDGYESIKNFDGEHSADINRVIKLELWKKRDLISSLIDKYTHLRNGEPLL